MGGHSDQSLDNKRAADLCSAASSGATSTAAAAAAAAIAEPATPTTTPSTTTTLPLHCPPTPGPSPPLSPSTCPSPNATSTTASSNNTDIAAVSPPPSPPASSQLLQPAVELLQLLQREASERRRISLRLPSWVSRNASAATPTSASLTSQERLRPQNSAAVNEAHNGSSNPQNAQEPPSPRLPAALTSAAAGENPRDNPGSVGGVPLTQAHPTSVPPSHKQPSSALTAPAPAAIAAAAAATAATPSSLDTQNTDSQPVLESAQPVVKQRDADRSISDPSSADGHSIPPPSRRLSQSPASRPQRKMHQTSSRLLRMTDDDRPFTRDFKDLFSTLVVSLPLTPHRVKFQKVNHTFTSEEAITNLGSLKFSQSNRMPDPKDPSRIVTTTTTTTFSMAREMARSVCQKFLEARFVESVDGKNDFTSKGAVWQLTSKGMAVLARFCQRNGISARHVMEALNSDRNKMHLVILEREADTDKLHRDQATIEVIFRRFAGIDGPNIKENSAASDSDSLSEYASGLIGVRMAKNRKVGDRTYHDTFTGKTTIDWLMDCCTLVDRRETIELATLFCEYGLMQSVEPLSGNTRFLPSKNAVYYINEKGRRVAGWISSPKSTEPVDTIRSKDMSMSTKDSNANRMTIIIRDPALRLLFREYLRDTHCEENLSFYVDVRDFLSGYSSAKRSSAVPKFEAIRETLAAAYSLYNAFLAPGSPCELNIDHTLRTALAARMTRAVGDDEAMVKSLDEVATLFDQAQVSVFKLMASDSVPKFMREPKYASILRERNLDSALGGSFSIRT